MNEDIKKLKFIALKEKLDYQGNIIEEKIEKTVDWCNYNPEEIMNSVIRDGDYRHVRNPLSSNYATEAFEKLFGKTQGYNTWDEIHEFKSIESEIVNNCMKFVIYDRNSGETMKWVSV